MILLIVQRFVSRFTAIAFSISLFRYYFLVMEERTQNSLSDKQVLDVIMQYANSKVDYAIMLSGPWGSGKTYFVENQLCPKLEETKDNKDNNITYIYLSLYGIKNVEQFRNELYSRIASNFTNTLHNASNIAGLLTEISTGSNTQVNILMRTVKRILDSGEAKVIADRLTSNLFLVVDDLERYEGNDYKELLGFITSKCLKNNVHVLFVCNEDNLISIGKKEWKEDYFLIKEKSIRHTISYRAEIHKILLSILNNENRYPCLSEYKKHHTPDISKLFRTLEDERNIRTWYVAFDCFEKYAKDYGEEIQEHPKYLESILRDFLISASVYNKFPTYFEKTNANPYSKEEMDKKEQQTKDIEEYVSDTFHFHYASNPFELIYDRTFYLEHPTKDFFVCDSIFEYLKSGYLDYQKVKEHFDKIYPIPTVYETAYMNLMNYSSITDDEMAKAFADFRIGLNNHQYTMFDLLNIIILESEWKQDHYLELFHKEDLITLIEEYCKNYDFSFLNYQELSKLIGELERISFSPLFNVIKDSAQRAIEEKEKNDTICSIDRTIDDINMSLYNMNFSSIKDFVEKVVVTNSYERIKSLNCNGLYVLSYFFKGIEERGIFTDDEWQIKPFYDNLLKYSKNKPNSKWDIDFNKFLRSVKRCL